MRNKLEIGKRNDYVGVTYQSNYLDFYFQYFLRLSSILYGNKIEGILLRKTIISSPENGYCIEVGYGLFLDIMILGFRFGIYLTLTPYKDLQKQINKKQQ